MVQAQVPFTPPAIPPAYLVSYPPRRELPVESHPELGRCVRLRHKDCDRLVPLADWRRFVDDAADGLLGVPFADLIEAHQLLCVGQAEARVGFFGLGVVR